MVHKLKDEGLQLFDNTEVMEIKRDLDMLCFCIKVKMPDGDRTFYVRNLVLATGALDIQDKLVESVAGLVNNYFEIGVRVEAPNNAFGNVLSTHGDLKLKYKMGRTYCVTSNGRIVTYQTQGLHFLEGYMEPSSLSGYTNLAVLIKIDNNKDFLDFVNHYRKEFGGIPIKQRFVDYAKDQINVREINTTLDLAICGDINKLFQLNVNEAIKNFIKVVLVGAMNLPEDAITLVAPELKILRNLQIDRNFELDHGLFVIGSATGKFRGILQSFCSGIRCGQLLIRR